MKVSLNWLKEYIELEEGPEEVAEILTSIGLEVGGVEETESIKGGLEGVVAGLVTFCDSHPNADRLSVCRVDIGTGKELPIVCGAPNVAKGQKVWVATVGTSLYPAGADEELVIRKAKIRGEVSEGMICAEDELGLGDDHTGIMVLPDDVEPGTLAAEYYKVSKDHVIDIDLTPNRSDAICHIGVAEDLAAYLRVNNDREVSVSWPAREMTLPEGLGTPVTVEVLDPQGCPRYAGLLLEGVRVNESPQWLKERLNAIGMRPVNNIVDITNFVLHEMGQPLHAFDADKIAGNKVIVQTLEEDTRFVTLDEVERKLSSEDLMICDGEGNGMCIAGVFGGVGTGVTESTSRVFLESAHFDPVWIRKTATRHQLRTDAARAFEKTTDPNVCVTALKRAASLIMEHANGTVVSDIIDVYPVPVEKRNVAVRWERINRLIGIDIPGEKVREVFAALSMDIISEDGESVTVAVPTNKADVTREADVIEEVLRIYGFNQVPLLPKMEVALTGLEQPTLYKMRHIIGSMLAAEGFCEMMGLSLTDVSNISEGPLAIAEEQRVVIENTSNVNLNVMRPGMLVTALEVARYNQNRGQDRFRMYEFGYTYNFENDNLREDEYLTFVMTGSEQPQNWLDPRPENADVFTLKKYVHAVLDKVGLQKYRSEQFSDGRFEVGMRYNAYGVDAVEFGLVDRDLAGAYDISRPLLFAQLRVDALFRSLKSSDIVVADISRFPGVKRDLAFILAEDVTYESLARVVRKSAGAHLAEVELFDVYRNPEHLGPDRKSYAVQLYFESPEKTLTDKEVARYISKVVGAVAHQLGGSLRE